MATKKKAAKKKTARKFKPSKALLKKLDKVIDALANCLDDLEAAKNEFEEADANGDAELDPESDTDSGWGAGVR